MATGSRLMYRCVNVTRAPMIDSSARTPTASSGTGSRPCTVMRPLAGDAAVSGIAILLTVRSGHECAPQRAGELVELSRRGQGNGSRHVQLHAGHQHQTAPDRMSDRRSLTALGRADRLAAK